MASLFSSPSAPPAPYTEPAPTADPDAEAREARLGAMERRRRGRAGTVVTSERGLLASDGNLAGKTLLGE